MFKLFNVLKKQICKISGLLLNRCRLNCISIHILLIFIFIISSSEIFAQNKKILVLGFSSVQLNEVQGRLLRDTFLRKLHEGGFEIVPVMEVESIINDYNITIIDLEGADLKRISRDLELDYSLMGKIYPVSKKKLNIIKPGHEYFCQVILYKKLKNEFIKYKFKIRSKNTLFEFYSDISMEIISGLKSRIK